MSKKQQENYTEPIMSKVTPSVRRQIEELARREDRTLSYIVRRFIEQGLKEQEAA